MSTETESSFAQLSTSNENSKEEATVYSTMLESSKQDVDNNIIIAKISLSRGTTPQKRKHKKYRLYLEYDNDIFMDNAIDVTPNELYTFIEETVEYDDVLFSTRIYANREDSEKNKRPPKTTHFQCMDDRCKQLFQCKASIKPRCLACPFCEFASTESIDLHMHVPIHQDIREEGAGDS
ncbi:hypothetical protein RF11_03690 [Thelohanellus kitauei]|uniref:Uncharacterized protein n=1 Tax=Thelohanellus kitauei TaxID=669202 RepID=A0A0C2N560_THEKT|nr:hypothetical protein RF11_03690 [Thelohanellus kitauei]